MTINRKKLVPPSNSWTHVKLNVYKTDESKVETNTPSSNDSEGSDIKGFHYHTGKLLETKIFKDIADISFGDDYTGFVGEANVTLPYRKKDLLWLYKGVRCRLFVTRKTDKNAESKEVFFGFIKDLNINESSIELQLTSYSSLLEKQLNVSYTKLPRSQILANIIKKEGLIPKINVDGLKDDVIDWTSVSTTGDNSSTGGVKGDGSMTDAEITQLAKKVSYGGMGSGHDPEKGFKNLTVNHRGDCYDITAGLYYAYNFKVGIPARDIVASSSRSNSGTHHCCQIQQNGNWVFPDFYKYCTGNLRVNAPMKKGKFEVAREPPSSDGTIPSYCAKCKKRWP